VADWSVEFTPRAEKALSRLDRSVRKRVVGKLQEIQGADDPRDFLKPMTGPLTGMFRLRVGGLGCRCFGRVLLSADRARAQGRRRIAAGLRGRRS